MRSEGKISQGRFYLTDYYCHIPSERATCTYLLFYCVVLTLLSASDHLKNNDEYMMHPLGISTDNKSAYNNYLM